MSQTDTHSANHGRFLPGTVLASRYRINGLLGAGAMGEVYRADDLKLGQVVALKFLTERIEGDSEQLDRFLAEARIARQISHPNVCRVHDVGEVDGHHFLSMEFVDGETLASLLRRIGRLPGDRAIEIARQLCAGLFAAHEQGILHRDLKPANVMIDGRGSARITDFGLAVHTQQSDESQVAVGTPEYMAPEQFAGHAASVKSDLYALGLVLFELFTGRQPFSAESIPELVRLKQESRPAPPSNFVTDLDAAVERILLRCLETDPRDRPSSAWLVGAALPGSDPLRAAVAEGKTPSPELVAEAGSVGGLRPRAAIVCIFGFLFGLALAVYFSARTQLSRVVPLPKPPEVLAERARDILRSVGRTEGARDSARGFAYSKSYVDHLVASLPPPIVWQRLGQGPPYAINYWYRESPGDLVAYLRSVVDLEDPPTTRAGMADVLLDPAGRLQRLEAVPPEHDVSKAPWPESDWTALFDAAGLARAGFSAVEPRWSPPFFADHREAWEGTLAGTPEIPIRVEAASYHGLPVWFRILWPWDQLGENGHSSDAVGARFAQILFAVACIGILIGGALLARRNLRLGRGDRRGAAILALFVLGTLCVQWILTAHHVPVPTETQFFIRGLSIPVLVASISWVCYLSIEPYVRRNWPNALVSWVRLLDGQFRDPLVGRDVVFGLLIGLGLTLLGQTWCLASRWTSVPVPPLDAPPAWFEFEILSGLRFALGNFFEIQAACLFLTCIRIVSLLLLRVVLRKQALAIVAFVLIWTVLNSRATSAANSSLSLAVVGILQLLFLAVFFRLGLLAILVGSFFSTLLSLYPLTPDFSAWFAASTVLVLCVAAGLAIYGVRVALAGRAIFSEAFFRN